VYDHIGQQFRLSLVHKLSALIYWHIHLLFLAGRMCYSPGIFHQIHVKTDWQETMETRCAFFCCNSCVLSLEMMETDWLEALETDWLERMETDWYLLLSYLFEQGLLCIFVSIVGIDFLFQFALVNVLTNL
jgi:hypothetical protein